MNSSVAEKNLYQITDWEALGTPSFYRKKIYQHKERGYCSIQLDEKLMGILNQSNGVRETLSNLVRFTSSSNFVFQQENNAKIDLSKTRCLLILVEF